MWANQPPSRQGWGRNGESGSAFRGMSRGRPGRGGGRGGRGGGRGGSRAAGPNARPDDRSPKPNGNPPKDISKDAPPSALAAPSNPAPPKEIPSPALSKSSTQSKDTKPRPRKASEAKPPRKVVPPIVIEPPPAAASNSPISATTPNRSRRKRSQNRSMSSASSTKKSPSTESSTSLLRAEKSPTITKDLPPHLAPAPPETPSFDIKHDINALVERVRAVAMDRPNTPGSHIDWAGDDDDSLPDLDDWGVKSVTDKSTSSSIPEQPEKPDLLSPMLADALKTLPSVEVGSPLTASATPPVEAAPAPVPPSSKSVPGDDTPRGPINQKNNVKERSVAEKAPPTGPKKQMEKKKTDTIAKPSIPAASVPKPAAEQVTATKVPSPKAASLPLHPSLPAKPVEAIDALAKRAPRKPPVPVQTPDPTADVDAPPKSGLSESMHAPKADAVAAPETSSDSPSPEPQGTSASMHAPVHSAPSHITTHSTPSFHPSHGRAHTIGRPRDLRAPFGGPHGAIDGHLDERASRRDRVNHARTHSSPPTGPGTSTAHSRTIHASRPVITVAALSGLARALGAPPSKREAASVGAASKE